MRRRTIDELIHSVEYGLAVAWQLRPLMEIRQTSAVSSPKGSFAHPFVGVTQSSE